MSKLSKHDLAIWEAANRLYVKSLSEDLEHDAHRIFQLTGEAAKQLIVGYDYCPLACNLAQALTDFWTGRWRVANTIPQLNRLNP